MAQKQEDISAQLLSNLSRQQSAYSFGGGSIGGNIWSWRQPNIFEIASGKTDLVPELRQELRGKVNVMPAGRGAAQELQGMREAGGRPYVEAPERFERGAGTSQLDRSDQFYSTVTGRPMGTMMGMGEYGKFGPAIQTSQRSWTNYTGDRPISGMNYENSPVWGQGGTRIPERSGPRNPEYAQRSGFRSMGLSGGPQPNATIQTPTTGSPQSFAGFGGMMREQEEEMNRGLGSLTGFGGIPRFPFSNY